MKIRKMQTAAGGSLRLAPEELKYLEWSKMTPELKREYRINRAKSHLLSGPNITNFWEAFQTYIGNRDPKNPHLNTGIVNAPGRATPQLITQTATKIGRTLEDYLKATKVSAPILEGSTMARSSYATDRFIGGRLFLNTLPEEAMKILGHGMAKSPTILDALARLRYILDNGIKGKFYTAPLKVSKEAAMAGEAIGTGGATPYFDGHFLITGKPGLMINSVDDIGTVYINDAYENEEALKAALKLLQYLLLTYPKINFKLYSLGFKQGGKMNILEFLKNGSGIHIKKKNRGSFTRWCGGNVTEECIRRGKASSNPKIRKKATFADNVRHFKHEQGGIIKAKEGFNLGQLLNNDAITGGIQTILGSVVLKNNLNKSKAEQEAYLNSKYNSNLIDTDAIWNEVGKNLLILLYLNPDVHFSKIDLQLLFEQAKRKQVLNLEKLKAIEKQQLAYENSLQENATNSNLLSGIFNVGTGALKYISDVKKDKNKNTTPITSNYQLDSFWTNPSLT